MKILVSACLCGTDCKYNGGNNFNKNVSRLMDNHTIICVCPEVLGGLPTPRTPAEISNGKVITKDGNDVTENFQSGALAALEIAKKYDVDIAILKANSPSCGCGEIYDGSFSKKLIPGDGIFAQKLKELNIPVYTENDELKI